MDKLSVDEITARLAKLPGWERKGEAITKTFEMSDFIHAVGFVVEVGMIAEGLWHHPDLTIRGWNKVEITASSHDAGTVTKRDLDLATKIEETLKAR